MVELREDLVAALAGRYDIEREIGHGGMATVYLARDVRHGRHVAVKVLRSELATTLGAERFLREIDIMARLTHPNILALRDSGMAAGVPYFVMPYVEGETLRDRLDREHQLPIDEALSITRQAGLALDYAHEHGVIHRDIKPENLLLVGDHVLVADFGLARALYSARTDRLTEPALAVGTPAYMSPEQAAADHDVDGRTDLYSLACVLYEMLAGVPPFKGATAAAVLAQHLTATPPSMCAQRPHCPPNVCEAVARALEKTPADRFRTARDFVAALTTLPVVPSPALESAAVPQRAEVAPTRRERTVPLILLAVVGAGIAIAATMVLAKRGGSSLEAAADRNSYVVLPLTAADPAARRDTAVIARRIADAIGEWDGLQVVGSPAVAEQIARLGLRRPLRLEEAFDVAARLRGARLVWGDVSSEDGTRSVRLELYDVATRSSLRPAVVTYGAAGPTTTQLRVAASLLLRGRGNVPWAGRATQERPSLPAWLAYDAGRDAISRWDVVDAAREFQVAVLADKSHAQANLWLSLAKMWSGEPVDRWHATARRAYDLRDHLDPSDTMLARAQLAIADERYPDACAAYREYSLTDTTGVIGWYGLGECQSRDSLVVRDPASRSAWRFRGSMQQAINAYLRIIEKRAGQAPTFVYTRLAQVLYTTGNRVRPGHSLAPNRLEFIAYPVLEADTLAFTPYLVGDRRVAAVTERVARGRAIEQNRAVLLRLYRDWSEDAPPTVDAHTGLAALLETLEEVGGDESDPYSALGHIQRARSLASDPRDQLSLAKTELRVLVKRGDWRRAARITDSVFAANPTPTAENAAALRGPAALSGRIRTLGALLQVGGAPTFPLTLPNGAPLDLSPALEQDADETFAFAITGACVDTLRHYRARVDRQLASYIADRRQRAVARDVLLGRPLSVGVPCVGAGALAGIDPHGSRLMLLEQALGAHDLNGVRRIYAEMIALRSFIRPGDVSMDNTFMESWIMAAIGDTAEAITHLDRSLEALPTLGTYLMDYPAHSAGLVRAMGLRAELGAARGDGATAARWGGAVATLWEKADGELQPYVRKMRQLAALKAAAEGQEADVRRVTRIPSGGWR